MNWLAEYKKGMDSRYPTFAAAFHLLSTKGPGIIVETGCIRLKDDWGAGQSTMLFGEYCNRFGGTLITIDNVAHHMETCRELTKQYEGQIIYVADDSVSALKKLPRLGVKEISLLYLDSFDVDLEGDRTPCQLHNLNEFKAAELMLKEKSIVLIDDYFDGNGKGRLTQEYMLGRGWKMVKVLQQQLFVKAGAFETVIPYL